ncbi:lysophospholipid acyltransferase family protein [Microbulbifer sp. S227A]|uniref:lysophospholipid acyltransferase family protein n=1 Tax=Microbulbifer sp. S227A TaxID=3415131 RepID=UPI003C7AEDBE
MSLRKRIADSAWLNRSVEGAFAAHVRFAHRSSSWRREGFEPMDAAAAAGEPVIMVLWHQRLFMAPYMFDTSKGPICTLTSSGRAGRMVGQILYRFGMDTVAMSSHARNLSLTREVMGKMRSGISIGIAADGPRGPARICSTVPLAWARASGKRVFVVSYSARRVLEFPTWDRMWLPAPWTSGVIMCREWKTKIPRAVDAQELEHHRLDLQAALNAVTDACDRAIGREPGTPSGQ